MATSDDLEQRVANVEAAVRAWEDRFQTVFSQVQGLLPQGVPVGTIVASLLPWDVFKRVTTAGDGFWVPADGRSLPDGCRYRLETGRETAFDLRGMFLRGLNTFTDDLGARADTLSDPETRSAGDAQAQAIAAHGHVLQFRTVGVPPGSAPIIGRGLQEHWAITFEGGAAELQQAAIGPLDPHSTETRPSNVAVYWYLKIN